MPEHRIQPRPVNLEALDDVLRAQLGEDYAGTSVSPDEIIVHFKTFISPAHQALIEQLIANHDPASLSQRQQAALQRQQRLQNARDNYEHLVDLDAFAGATALIRNLAESVHLLALEIDELRTIDN